MVRSKSDITPYKGIYILLSQESEHDSVILDNGNLCAYFPLYIERKLFHMLFDSTSGTWTATVLSAQEVMNGIALQIVRKFAESPVDILLILVAEASSLKTLGQITEFVLKDQNLDMPVFVQKEDAFAEIKVDADRQLLNSKYGRYCIKMSFAKSEYEHAQDGGVLQTESMYIVHTNPVEAQVRNIINEQRFRI
ncbi:MAG: hypothetical protein KBC22_00990 [Candidatus Pacebacteria bacterium]|nr:hypothetical protein [Candidatus Paceibacterota bacterium]